ncbi:MAG: hypothetical protein V4681_00775 [Patescibacteria group bacterium]
MKKSLTSILVLATIFGQVPAQVFAQTPEEPCVYDADFNQRCLQDDGSILEIPNPFFEAREALRARASTLALSASWNGTGVASVTSLPIDTDGTLSVSYVPHPQSITIWGRSAVFADVLASSTLMASVFEGELGSSTLVAVQAASHDSETQLPLHFARAGKYVIALTANFPDSEEGSVPGFTADALCVGAEGDICATPSFPFDTFRSFVEKGKEQEGSATGVGDFTPPILGLLEIEVSEGVVTGASNVLFIPGFTASRLYTKEAGGDERRLWEPNGSDDVRDLALLPNGTSPLAVYTRDIVDSILGLPFGFTVHKKFMEYLGGLKTEGKIVDWKGYPYDWRYDVFDVVDNGALKEDGSREYLETVVEGLAASSKNGKVAIVAHSNGGLVAKALLVRLQAEGKMHLVDKLILIASPQAGTPKGLFSLMHGRDKLLNYIIPAPVLRATITTLPGAYALAPSNAYFEEGPMPLARFLAGGKTDGFVTRFGATLDSAAEARSFELNDPVSRPVPSVNDTGTPLPLSSALVEKMETTHAILDAWSAPTGVEVYEIAGWGQPTITSASYYTINGPCPESPLFCTRPVIEYGPRISSDGDETVMSSSALLQGKGKYFNLSKLNEDFDQNRKHLNITESEFTHEYIGNVLGLETSYDQTLFAEGKPTVFAPITIVGIHSPAVLLAKDSSGNETGIFANPASDLMYVKEEIPGSSVQLGGEGKYLVLPKTGAYSLAIEGTGSGTFDLTFSNENGQMFKEFKGLPVSSSTEATLSLSGTNVGQLSLDVDGDGQVDAKVNDKLTRKDAIAICKKEIGRVPTIFIRLYLALVISNIELQGKDDKKFLNYITEIRKYVQAQIKAIPSQRAAGIATCINALENSKK